MAERIVVAMSGGVDSSTAAVLLVKQGYEVVGLMLRLWAELQPGLASTNRCCSLESVDDARAVAARLGIPFYLINVEQRFREQVVDYFIGEYAAGRTPNPCVACNRHIRFGFLLDYARLLGATYLATGHYARVCRGTDGRWQLWRGVDRAKDQSYVLHSLGQEQLSQVLFPLGAYTKTAVRGLAAEHGLPTAGRQESQDLCFLADGDYRRFLRQWAPAAIRPGPIFDGQGREIGRHQGLPCYTIGQRRGLGIAAAELGQDHLLAVPVNWIAGEPPAAAFPAEVQVRYHATPVRATVTPLADARAEVALERPVRDITPGQYVVFYDGERCLGGGAIERAAADGNP